MDFIADLHIHSHYSIATSRHLVPEYLEYWARIKGISVLGTGDCIHPGWMQELREKLEPTGNGLFRLRDEYRLRESRELSHAHIPQGVHFMLTGEISTIYKKDGRVRKVHSLCLFPGFDQAISVQGRLDRIGNIRSDGRPVLGLDCRDLLEMVLDSGEGACLIPAHIWTPWFSVLGSKSGFDSLEECFDDLTGEIFAVETGLSSDPPMNRACSFLDPFTLVSNSDAHSPEKLGREATLFCTDIDYRAIHCALRGEGGYAGTIEFFPQEGKYHYDGHRKCGICWDPVETLRHGGICPHCGREVTRGVMHRVAQLADRGAGEPTDQPFLSITALPDLLAEMLGQKNTSSRKVTELYHRIIRRIGSEFHVLLHAEGEEIAGAGGELLAEGIRRLRRGEVTISEGYDGEYGKIRVYDTAAGGSYDTGSLFALEPSVAEHSRVKDSLRFDIDEFRARIRSVTTASAGEETADSVNVVLHPSFTEDQMSAIAHGGGPCFVIAGPGSGKTMVLTWRVRHLMEHDGIAHSRILLLTFSNRAAMELRDRLGRHLREPVMVSTMHSFGLQILAEHRDYFGRSAGFRIAGDDERVRLVRGIAGDDGDTRKLLGIIESVKTGGNPGSDPGGVVDRYNEKLQGADAFDLDDLISLPVMMLEGSEAVADLYRSQYTHLLLDEAQDINAMQYRLIRALAGPGSPHLFVVGDPDQSIYGFRGAGAKFMEELMRLYPCAATVSLKKSFRCPDGYLKSARQVLRSSATFTGVPSDVRIQILKAQSDRSEADWIAGRIESDMGGVRSFSRDSGMSDGDAARGDVSFSDFAVLCRSSFQFNAITEAMRNHGIPYLVVDRDPFYRKPPYAGPLDRLRECLSSSEGSRHEQCPICAMIVTGEPVKAVVRRLADEAGLEAHERKRLIDLSIPFGDRFNDFMRSLELRQGADDLEFASSSVTVMTMHASKGLEFDTVFIPGCEEGIIPFTMFGEEGEEHILEEERLLYVAMTRSRRCLVLTHTEGRTYRGRTMRQTRSRFLQRIEGSLLDFVEREKRKGDYDGQMTLF